MTSRDILLIEDEKGIAEFISQSLANGGLNINYNPGYALPDDVKALAENTIQGIIDGSIQVEVE